LGVSKLRRRSIRGKKLQPILVDKPKDMEEMMKDLDLESSFEQNITKTRDL